MGHVHQRLKLSAVNEEELTLVVDTGATYSPISPALADRLGVVRFPERLPVTLLVATRTWTARLGGVLAVGAP